ncbi:recombinase family protein [Bradyrhizobium sp. F1.4.3]|uniref:recombinase family protein n=1 Tax=Bradyrhizobium sp. F1.4.3 TaxID=3156356 RepID=UPI003392E6B9
MFAKFRELQSACRVMRYLDRYGLSLPVRALLRPSPHEIVWRAPDSARVLSVLRNPAYAGVYVYGRRQKDPSRCRPESLTGTVKVAIRNGRFACTPLPRVYQLGGVHGQSGATGR